MRNRHLHRGGITSYVLILAAAVLVTAVATYWVSRTWLAPVQIEPVSLDSQEAHALEQKLSALARTAPAAPTAAQDDTEAPRPEPYRETSDNRTIVLTERELNAMIAQNPDLAGRMALHLGQDSLSANMLIPMPEDFPLLGGTTLRVSTGLTIAQRDGGPAFIVEGVSLMGVPLPSAWLGGLKGQDLMDHYRPHGGFWQAVGEGIEHIHVERGRLHVQLAE